ncbi:cation-translocating P-type ATPase [Candidatus Gottesmanbacteria bacterium]|nr:cation-translocating P-type ATPase [Candidatus Gottesmanbacteria bacterium]
MDNEIFKNGLTARDAEELLEKHGLNEIKETSKFTLLKSFLSQFNNFLTILLILAACISFLLGERIDSFFIFLIVILNSLFGLYQEAKAEKSLETLKQLTVSLVRVVRDGKQQEIDSRFLVPGDIVYLEEGNKIPADGKVLESMHLEVNEASLTGESLPVDKKEDDSEKNSLFMGTVVAKGRGYIKVEATGSSTRFGQIAKTLASIEKVKTPLQKKLEVFTKQIGMIGILASVSVFILSFVQDKTLIESFIFAVSLAVAAVPEGLPAVMTITLAIGVEKMAKKKAIIRKLNSIEALGSVTLVATDKTGTLTTNKMRVKKIWVDEKIYDSHNPPSLSNHPFSKMLLNAALCSTASIVFKVDHGEFDVVGDPTEGATLLLAQKAGFVLEMARNEWKTIDERSFNPVAKRMTVEVKKEKEHCIFTKGAPESILSICSKIMIGREELPLTMAKKAAIEKEFQQFAKKGLRMIAFSCKTKDGSDLEKGQVFLGFVGIADPVRAEVKKAVIKAKEAGIKVIMITGDNELTAEAVGIETGIITEGEEILTGKQLDSYSDEELFPLLSKVKIYARTTPDHKYRLVKLYQKQKEVVSVTGDGVNDALALKQADVGVAMGITGTDVAKETADMIVTDDNFASLINAVEYGRNIFNQIKNAIKYLLACNLGEVIYVITAVVFHLPVITPLQILYINIATDGIPAISLAFSPNDKRIMLEKPKRIMSILGRRDYYYIFFVGLLTAVLAFIATIPFMSLNGKSISVTILFTVIIIIQQFILLDIWVSHRPIIRNLALVKNPIFFVAFFLPFIMHPVLLYHPFFNKVFDTVPLSPLELIFSVLISLLIIVVLELTKIRKKIIFK